MRPAPRPSTPTLALLMLLVVSLSGCVSEPTGNETTNSTEGQADDLPEIPVEPIEVGTVHLTTGEPLTFYSGVAGETLDVSEHIGSKLHTETVDNSGLGYDIDLYIEDADGNQMQACDEGIGDSGDGNEKDCPVPEGAAVVRVTSFSGQDLDVTVFATP